jgi:alpha-amylase
VAQRSGDDSSPGLLLHLNASAQSSKRTVVTPWKNALIYDYSENSTQSVRTDAQGRAEIATPSRSYSVWSLKNF